LIKCLITHHWHNTNLKTILRALAVGLPFAQVIVLLALVLEWVVAYPLFAAFVIAFENLFLLELTFVPTLLPLRLN
jgi:hypothetical protein